MNSLLDQLSNDPDPGDSSALRQLLTHVPDVVINCDHKKSMPRVKHVVGVCMFADISGELKDLVQFESGSLFLCLGLIHTDPSRKRSFSKTRFSVNRKNLKTSAFRFLGTEIISKTKFYENDDVTIIT